MGIGVHIGVKMKNRSNVSKFEKSQVIDDVYNLKN